MNAVHQLTLMLAAKAASSNNYIFSTTSNQIMEINEKIQELDKKRVRADKFSDLKDNISQAKEKSETLARSQSELSSKLKKSDQAVVSQKNAVKKAEDAYYQYRIELDNTKKVSEAQRQEKKRLKETYDDEKRKLAELKTENRDYAKELEKIQKESSGTNKKLKAQTEQMQNLEKELEDAGIDTKRLTEAQSDMGDSLRKLTDKQKDFNDTMEGRQKAKENAVAYGQLALASAGLVAAFAKPTQSAIEFESAISDVKKVVDFDSSEELTEFTNGLMNLSEEIPMTVEELAEIAAAGGQAGIAKDELLGFAESASKMGVAFDMEANEAGESMAKWRAALGITQEEVNTLADKINYLGNNSAAGAGNISEVITRVGALSAVGGVAADTLASMATTMIAAGTNSEIAATGSKNFILSLTKGESATKSQAAAFEKLGLSATDMATAMQEDSEKAIVSVLEKVKGLNKEEQISVLTKLFGSESVAAIANLVNNLDGFKQNLADVSDETKYAGSMEAEFAAKADTAESSLSIMRSSFNNLSSTFGQLFLPAAKGIADVITKVSQGIRQFINDNPDVAKVIGYTAAGFAVLTTGVFGFLTAASGISFIFKTGKIATLGWIDGIKKGAEKIAKFGSGIKGGGIKALSLLKTAMSGTGKIALMIIRGVKSGGIMAFNLLKSAISGVCMAVKLLGRAFMMNPLGFIITSVVLLAAGFVLLYKKSDKFRKLVNKIKDKVVELGTAGFEFITGKITAFKELLSKIKIPSWIKKLGEYASKGWNFLTGGGGETTVTTTTKDTKKKDNHLRLARGGIATKPTFAEIGEGGEPEAVMPLSKLKTMVNNLKGGSGASSRIEYKPTYVFKGGAPTKSDLVAAEQMSQSKFNKMMQQYERDKRRTKFALT